MGGYPYPYPSWNETPEEYEDTVFPVNCYDRLLGKHALEYVTCSIVHVELYRIVVTLEQRCAYESWAYVRYRDVLDATYVYQL